MRKLNAVLKRVVEEGRTTEAMYRWVTPIATRGMRHVNLGNDVPASASRYRL